MNQELTYTVSEAVAALSDPIKNQTLYSWVRKIEKYTPKYFLRRIDKDNPYFVHGEPTPQLLIREKEILQFEEIIQLRKRGVRLEKAIFEVFLRKDDYEFLRENNWNYKLLKEKVLANYKEKEVQ
ncbi:hypothetical protein VBG69_00170 [Carnobacterium maltaromaticum]|uniref:hypothetical protein n=1 Tax=Carnobacterium maltaromaticum TaxID=2751 RepID=UPI003796D938